MESLDKRKGGRWQGGRWQGGNQGGTLGGTKTSRGEEGKDNSADRELFWVVENKMVTQLETGPWSDK